MWWQRGAVLTLSFSLQAANLHRTTHSCAPVTCRSTLSSLLIKLGRHIRAGWDVTVRNGGLWKGKRCDGENISLHSRFKRRSPDRRSYFYTVIITEADRHTDGDQRGKRTKRRKKRTKRVHFLPKLHQKYLEEWCIPKQKQIRDVSSRLSLCY